MSDRCTACAPRHETAATLLLALAFLMNDDGESCPSVKTLAGMIEKTVPTVRRAVKTLIEAGRLEVDYGAGPGGVNVYRLPPEDVRPLRLYVAHLGGDPRFPPAARGRPGWRPRVIDGGVATEGPR